MVNLSGLLVEKQDGIATVKLNRPQKLNALSRDMLDGIVEIFDDLDRDPDTQVVVLTSAGKDAFSAGADVHEMADRDQAGEHPYEPMKGMLRNTYETVLECRKPTIAALRGWVVGGGMELAMACDMRIASRSAKFLMPEAKVGLGANFGSQMLPRLVPHAHAFHILYTALEFDAEHAFRIGFISQLVEEEELEPTVHQLARLIASRAPITIRRYKAMVNLASTLPIASALRLDPGVSPYSSLDRVEGAEAFKNKRQPQWRGQ